MKIGILQTGHLPPELNEKHGPYLNMFSKLLDGHGFSFTNYAVVDNEFPQSVDEMDGWLITGSRFGVYDDLDWIPLLEDFIRRAYEANIPTIGICFGHQLMAQALGGKVEKFASGWSAGHTDYDLVGEEGKSLIAMHQDQVTEIPEGATVIASNDFCANAGLAYKNNALSFQPHPEFTPEFTEDLIRSRAGTVFSQEFADEALAKIHNPNDSKTIADRMAKFFQERRQNK
ncbi:MAG: type 1 glutamine amidotransferase [Rhizobiaceae bacterium]